MSPLLIKRHDHLDRIFDELVDYKIYDWDEFIENLDPNIISSQFQNNGDTRITFKSDAHRNWFIMRWT